MNVDNPCWPSFLDLLNSEPDKAFEEFYRFAYWTLKKVSPRPMRGLCKEDQEDVIQDTIFHCVKDDFRVLRQYVNTGKPFAAYLYTIAHNVCIDYIRRKDVEPEMVSIHKDSEGKSLENVLHNPEDAGKKKAIWIEVLVIVKKMIERLDEYCRLLLEMAGDELTPQEMTKILRLPPEQNKKVSDDLRYCRKKLKKLLKERGYDLTSIINA